MSRPILLLDLPWTRDKDPRVALGHACLLAALTEHGDCSPRSLVMPANDPKTNIDALCTRILAESAGQRNNIDLAIGVYVWSEPLVTKLLPELRVRGFGGRIILGGPQISYAPPGVAALYPHADVFVRGFAENALLSLVSVPGCPRIPGVVYRKGIDLGRQAEPELDELPSPWLSGVVAVKPGGFVRWETQRGCPYKCSFCQHREAGNVPPRTRTRTGRLEQEIELFARRAVAEIAVLDPVFNARAKNDPHRADRILGHFLKAGYGGRLSLQCRPELIDDRFIAACARLDTKLEFGLQTTQSDEWRPIRRGNQLDRVAAAIEACQRQAIDHEVSLIFGLPEQTIASFERSLEWCLVRQVPVIKAFPLMLLRGTQLERERSKWALRETDTAIPIVCASSTFDEHDWLWMAQLSEALRMTEGNHPRSLEGLRALASDLQADDARWTPSLPGSKTMRGRP